MRWSLVMWWKCLKLLFRFARLDSRFFFRRFHSQDLPQELEGPLKELFSIINRPKTKQQEIAIAELLYNATVSLSEKTEEGMKRQNGPVIVLDVAVPRFAEMIVWFLAPPDRREALLGDLEEEYKSCIKRYGLSVAKRYYWWQVVKTCAALLFAVVQRVTVVEYILRRFGL